MKRIIFITVLLLVSLCSKADKHRKIEKSFSSANMKEVMIENSYGNIEVEQWDKDEIEIKVDIRVDARSEKKVNDLLDKIHISFIQKSNYLTVVTGFAENFSFKRFTNKIFSGGSLNIDYIVYLPKNIKLKLTNEKGNVSIGDFVGGLGVEIKNGDLELGKVLDDSSISVSFGKVNIDALGNSKCIFTNDKLVYIKKAEILNIDSKHSFLNIESVKNLVITASRGDCTVKNVEKLRGSSSFTEFKIGDIGDELVFDLWLGSMNIRNIHNMFSLVDLKSTRARLGLTFMSGAAYDISIRHNKNVQFDLPAGIDVKKRNAAESNIFITEGKYGDVNKFKSKVNINASNCKLFIQ